MKLVAEQRQVIERIEARKGRLMDKIYLTQKEKELQQVITIYKGLEFILLVVSGFDGRELNDRVRAMVYFIRRYTRLSPLLSNAAPNT